MPKYEPRVLKNKTDEVVEFMCGGRIYIYQPGEKRPEDGFVAHHALTEVNTGLTDVTNELDAEEEKVKDVALKINMNTLSPFEVIKVEPVIENKFKDVAWKDLLKMAGRYKFWKPGMNRQEIEKLLEDETRRESQALSGTASSEKKEGVK